jgi:uncharacterized protein YqhQ
MTTATKKAPDRLAPDRSLPSYGGQAVIEGVMMRGARAVAIAMRSPEQEIVLHTEELGGIYRSRIVQIPFLRGLVVLWDALGLGMRALTISANLQVGEEEQLEGPALYLTLGFSLVLGVGLFILTPAGLSHLAERYLEISPWWGNLIEGLVRLGILVGYIWAVGLLPDIKRVFGYHGAEHKTINAFEAGDELVPEVVDTYSREHPRCGTAFLLTVVLLSVVLFSFLGPLPIAWRLAGRILLLPVLATLSYEYIRWTAGHLDNPLVRVLIRPNLALQRLTTRPPSLEMLEVSIAAFREMQNMEQKLAAP